MCGFARADGCWGRKVKRQRRTRLFAERFFLMLGNPATGLLERRITCFSSLCHAGPEHFALMHESETMKDHTNMERWIARTFGNTLPVVPQTPAFRPPLTPYERRAEETTRAAREITESERERSQADVARLRQARLERDAHDNAKGAVKATKSRNASKAG